MVRSPTSVLVSTRQSSQPRAPARIGLPLAPSRQTSPASLATSRPDCKPKRHTQSMRSSLAKCKAKPLAASISSQVSCSLAMASMTRGSSGTIDRLATEVAAQPPRRAPSLAVKIGDPRQPEMERCHLHPLQRRDIGQLALARLAAHQGEVIQDREGPN